jgi:hypothetical protein
MATIDLITYDQKMVTPKDDALIHQFGISNGVLYGCDVTLADSNTLHITGGQGVIYGRQWEITEGDITVTLPASGSLKGRLYVKIDLSNTTNPIELLVQTDVTLPDLTDDDQINVNNSVSELELYTFDVSSLTISNLVKTVETVADGDHADVVQMQNDISQLNSSLTQFVTKNITWNSNPGGYTDGNYYIQFYDTGISTTDYNIKSVWVQTSKYRLPCYVWLENDTQANYSLRLSYLKSDIRADELAGSITTIIVAYKRK